VLTLLNDNGMHVINQGTSMAAPHATGASALLLQRFGAWTPEQVKAYFSANAVYDGYTGIVPNISWGAGKLHLGDLLAPTVAVTSPNGGEGLVVGTPALLTWNATDNVAVTSIELYLSRTGPAGTLELLASGLPNTGSYSWTVTGPATTDAYLKVVARDAQNNNASDLSNASFQIISGPTATLLSTFVANSTNGGIELRWQLADPSAFSAVSVERAVDASGPWDVLGLTPVQDADGFTVVDANVVDGASYLYRLQGVSARGTATTLGQITGTAGRAITEFALTRIAPNPSRGLTSVEFTVPRAASVKVAVLDVQGREVATLASGNHAPGRYSLTWTGEVHGRRAASGLYFVRMQAPGVQLTRRVIVSR
jgi:hypothetical protein